MNPWSSMRTRAALVVALLAVLGLYTYAFSQETPVGAVRGRVVAAHTGQPLAGITVQLRPKTPKDGEDVRTARTGGDGSFTLSRVPAGEYEFETLTTAYQNEPRPVAVREGDTASLDVSLKPGDPFLNLFVHQHAYLPSEEPRIAVNGFREGDGLKVQLLKVDSDALILDHGGELRQLLDPVSATGKPGTFARLKGKKTRPVRSIDHAVRERDAEGVFYEKVTLGRLPAGIYLVSARTKKLEALGWLMVTDLALVTKYAGSQALAFTCDLKTGRPVPGVTVNAYRGRTSVARGTTDSRGQVRLGIPAGSDDFSAVARRGDSLAFLRQYTGGAQSERFRAYIYTDRPVYRPGHQVRFKGIVRRLEGEGYAVPSPSSVAIDVRDYQDTSIYEGRASLSERGSFAGEFDLPAEVATGSYTLQVTVDGEKLSGDFVVASYRKPEWKVEVKTPKPSYVRGENVPVEVQAQYYFGSPVVNGKVHYTVYRSEYWSGWEGDLDPFYQEEQEHDPYGEVIASGDLTTDAGGTARFEFATVGTPEDDRTADYEYHIEVEVSDLSDRLATGSGRVRVSRGELTVETLPSRYVAAPREKVSVRARVRDLQQQQPAAGVALEIQAVTQNWSTGKLQERVVAQQTVTTDAAGEASLDATTPTAGLLVFRVSAKDRRGNTVESTADIWVTEDAGEGYAPSYPTLSVTPDRKQYRIGDTAHILVNTDRPGATALVAIEADRVLELQQIELTRKSTVLRFPIREHYEPNVFVTACFVHDKEFYTTQARLDVNADSHRLQVSIESDREVYKPRERATFRIRTTDMSGQPVPAEVSFGLVDESVYAIREDSKRGLWNAFYPRRWNGVNTTFSYPQVYLGDAAKDGSGETVRKNFPDTASWEPFVQTDRDGRATVTVQLPDSLTSWRATVQAHSPETEVGRETFNVRVTRELVLRLQAPRVFTEGDRTTVSAVAHNYSANPLDVNVDLRASGLTVSGNSKRRVRVTPGGAERLDWEVQAQTPGKAVLTAVASAGGLSDGMELTVPVRAFAREKVLFRSGIVEGDSAAEELSTEPGAFEGELELRASPTLAGTLLGGLEYLATYPYGCTEQTMSSFMPNLAIHQTLKSLSLPQTDVEQQLPAMVQAGLLRLYRYQHADGGWGWWEYDESDPWMTAYVLYGLTLAKSSGYPVNPSVLERAVNRATEIAPEKRVLPNQAAFLGYALAEAGKPSVARSALAVFEPSRLAELLDRKPVVRKDAQGHTIWPKPEEEPLRLRSLGYAVLGLAATGGGDDRRRAEELLREAWSRAVTDGGFTHWEEHRDEYFGYSAPQDVESTAVLLRAALQVTPEDPRLSGIVRWLLIQRNGSRWASTRDTAWILLALADYLKGSGELDPDYRLTVLVNGKEVHTHQVVPEAALEPETVVRIPLKDLQPQNRIEVRKDGRGVVYYSAKLTQQVRSDRFAPESAPPGLTVTREYFRLESRKDEAGRPQVVPAKSPDTRFRVGDRLLVRLKIHTDRNLEYLMLEDPIPTGWEVQDRGEVSVDEWRSWWSHTDVRDDRVSLFMRQIAPGDHVVEYYVRPEMAGTARVLPAVLSDMYVPTTRASTADTRVEIGK